MGRVVAIDGPSGSGKSTVARLIARALGFEYLDTGALYRAVALHLMRMGIRPEDPDEKIRKALSLAALDFRDGKVFLAGEDVSAEIRTKETGHYSSVFSARKIVRDFLLPLQRKFAMEKDLVAEGRDMATVVFPDAWKKFYLDASTAERARRRFEQMKDSSTPITMEEAIEDVVERDRRDSSRDIAPLTRSSDAIYIDTTGLNRDQVVEKIMEAIRN